MHETSRRHRHAGLRRAVLRLAGVTLASVGLLTAGAVRADAAVVTAAHDSARTAWYPDQPRLTQSLLTGGTFGQLFSRAITGQVYAQPLVSNGVLLVATEDNWIYGARPRDRRRQVVAQRRHAVEHERLGCGDLAPHVGVTGTPVIDDTGTGTAYFTSKSYVSGSSGTARYDVHAVDLATGSERAGFPVRIQGAAQNSPSHTFDAAHELQRPALLLLGRRRLRRVRRPLRPLAVPGLGRRRDHRQLAAHLGDVGRPARPPAATAAASGSPGGGIVSDGSGPHVRGHRQRLVARPQHRGRSPERACPDRLGESVVRLQVQANGTLDAGRLLPAVQLAGSGRLGRRRLLGRSGGAPVAVRRRHLPRRTC